MEKLIEIKELKDKLCAKYTRKYLAEYLGISENQIYRLLNEKSKMSLEQYKKLLSLYETC